MTTIERVPVALIAVETFSDALEQVYERVTEKAYESFLVRGCEHGHDLEDWFRAEAELIVKPHVDVRCVNDVVIFEAPVGNIDPEWLRLRITPHGLLIASLPDANGRQIFRIIQFPEVIDVNDIDAALIDGSLRVTAALAQDSLSESAQTQFESYR